MDIVASLQVSVLIISIQALIKKHEVVEQEIEGYKGHIDELRAESERLLKHDHFASEVIKEKQVHT